VRAIFLFSFVFVVGFASDAYKEKILLCETMLAQAIAKPDLKKVENVMEILDALDDNEPFVELYKGIAYSLKARDYNQFLSFTPFGFVRLKYVSNAIEYINKAYQKSDDDIVVSMYKGITFFNLPDFFETKPEGKKALLEAITNLESGNHKEVVSIYSLEEIKSTLLLYKERYEMDAK
jgi:hypothetical protein